MSAMDTIETTVSEDALAKDVKSASAAAAADLREMKSPSKTDAKTSSEVVEKEMNEYCEEPDDLLVKIEEAVKDKVTAENIVNDISQSSEHEFLKKLEELEKDTNASRAEDVNASEANVDECDKITVGKLVLEVSVNKDQDKLESMTESNCEEHVNELSSTTDDKEVDKDIEEAKDGKIFQEKVTAESSCCLKENGKMQENRIKDVTENIVENKASAEVETKKDDTKILTVSSKEKRKLEASSSSEMFDEVKDIPKEGEKVPEESEETIGSTTNEKLEEHGGTSKELSKSVEVEKQNEVTSEAMAIDDDLEPMEIDDEMQMDIDGADDYCEIIDEDMVSVDVSKAEQKKNDTKNINAEVQEPVVGSAKNETENFEKDLACASFKTAEEPESSETKSEEKTYETGIAVSIEIGVNSSDDAKINVPEESESNEAKADEKVCEFLLEKTEKTPNKEEKSVIEEKIPDSTTVSSQSENISLNVEKISQNTAQSPKKPIAEANAKNDLSESGTIKPLKKEEVKSSDNNFEGKFSNLACSSSQVRKENSNPKSTEVEVNFSRPSLEKVSPQKREQKILNIHAGKENTVEAKTELGTKYTKSEKSAKDEENEQKKETTVATKPKDSDTKVDQNLFNLSPKRDMCTSKKHELIDSSNDKKTNIQPEADSTKSEDLITRVVAEETTEKISEEFKMTPSEILKKEDKKSEAIKPVEIKEHHSDSTASLSSTADEQIIKLCLETTIPNTDNEQGHTSMKIENKPLLNMMKHSGSVPSLNTTPVQAPNVFNSTPIQKQFDISSENVSKISEATETSRTEKTVEDDMHHKKLNKPEYSSDMCTTTDHHSSLSEQPQSELQSSDGITKYVNRLKYNGITDSTTDEESALHIKNVHRTDLRLISNVESPDLKSNNIYEINVQYDEKKEFSFLSIQKLDTKKVNAALFSKVTSGECSDPGSSNGSISSLPPFSLPAPRQSEVSSSSSDTLQQDSKAGSSISKRRKITLQGTEELCNFIINEFSQLKKAYCGESDLIVSKESKDLKIEDEPTTPKSQHREYPKKNLTKGKSASPAISESSPSPLRSEKRSRKRSFTKSQTDEEDDEFKFKTKQPRKSQAKAHGTPSKEIESAHCELAGQCVLAKWVDKKYYAGRITGEKPGNKFVVLFEDGALKTLPKESIVFGEGDSLPLKDMNVHGLVDDDYECGVVVSIDKEDEKVLYTVQAEFKRVKITASDIYLTEEQAKVVQSVQNAQKKGAASATSPDELISSLTAVSGSRSTRNKRTSTSPVTPEPGYSGGTGKKGAKRQKRYS